MKYNILHTADWHLWHKHKYTRLIPGKHWDKMFEAKMDVLNFSIGKFLQENTVDNIVISGDIFEHYNPIEPIRNCCVRFIKEMLLWNPKGLIHILLGNHDIYKGQESLQAVKEAFYNTKNIVIHSKSFVILDNILIDHIGVQGFEARDGFCEKPENIVDSKKFDEYKLVLLGHYHKNQHNNKIFYSGSPYPIDFGEETDVKCFNTFNFENGKIAFKKHKIDGIKFVTLTGDSKIYNDENCKYYVLRLRKECSPDKEKIVRKELLEAKQLASEDDTILDAIIDLKVIKDSIKDKIKTNDRSIIDYRKIIGSLELDEKFTDYIYRKFENEN